MTNFQRSTATFRDGYHGGQVDGQLRLLLC
jgi:hypothetical protein